MHGLPALKASKSKKENMATATKTHTFITKLPGLRLTLSPERAERRDEFNRVLRAHEAGVFVQFSGGGTDTEMPDSEHGQLSLSGDEITEACEPCQGSGIVIRDGEGTDCPRCDGLGTRTRQVTIANGARVDMPFENVLQRLRNHHLANAARGFWDIDKAPDEPLPRAQDQIKAIVEASIKLDAPALRDVISLERETQNRREILNQAEAALEQVESVNATPETEAPPAPTADALPEGHDTAPPAEGEAAGQTAEAEDTAAPEEAA